MTKQEAEIIKLMIVVRLKMSIYELQSELTTLKMNQLEKQIVRLQNVCTVFIFVILFLLIKIFLFK